jgi:8-oxo-dGTP pyrophosphatase MutT (NUDIX family)
MSIDPRLLPLDRSFEEDRARAAALMPEQLTPAAVRLRFLHPGSWTPELKADARFSPGPNEAHKPAAVLVPLVRRDEQLSALLTYRARHLQDHAGQISFPGGRIEPSDQGPIDAALREAGEETGIPVEQIEVLGARKLSTITNIDVTPVVGIIAAPITLMLDSSEVEDAFEVPLSFLMNPGNHERRVVTVLGAQRFVYAIPFNDGVRMHFIWGATAAIVRNLYGSLGDIDVPGKFRWLGLLS